MEIHNIMNEIIQFQPKFSSEFGSNFDFADVRFKKDFGPWKKGDQVELLCLNIEDMTLGEFDHVWADLCPGDPPRFVKSCHLTFAPRFNHES